MTSFTHTMGDKLQGFLQKQREVEARKIEEEQRKQVEREEKTWASMITAPDGRSISIELKDPSLEKLDLEFEKEAVDAYAYGKSFDVRILPDGQDNTQNFLKLARKHYLLPQNFRNSVTGRALMAIFWTSASLHAPDREGMGYRATFGAHAQHELTQVLYTLDIEEQQRFFSAWKDADLGREWAFTVRGAQAAASLARALYMLGVAISLPVPYIDSKYSIDLLFQIKCKAVCLQVKEYVSSNPEQRITVYYGENESVGWSEFKAEQLRVLKNISSFGKRHSLECIPVTISVPLPTTSPYLPNMELIMKHLRKFIQRVEDDNS